jgi:TetR/AcrR family transcriptional regulator, transcriptional repressor for nem operon
MTQGVRAGNRGRPRAFDEAEFLNGAIALFSASGFSGVGVSELTKATGLTVGSVYKAYHDKEGVFVKALEHYIAMREAHIATILEKAENARAKIEGLFRLYVDLSKGRDGKLGCLIVAGIADIDQVGRAADIIRAQLSSRRTMLNRLIEEGQRDGSIAAKGDSHAIAAVLLALLQGMRVVGKAGELTENADFFVSRALRMLD